MIRLGQYLKFANLADTGGQARELIASGKVTVNGEAETRRGRQLHPGDEVTVTSGGQTVTETVDLTEPDVLW
ncbi:RNA-binding S4 domain-containing protein [Cutibacterium avidum]|uniref:RNA-binding S4 domain-containing protein n=1 Tax=Cutibacterium avidum TaxID=33010 RepID=UPI0005A20638|nr:RNA-binding S4 domain-containing protein [Cutibacterium avidum]MCO6672160.1 RNA-binding S4 domain-containing protein [Cutibacterium avidum]MDU5024185.1 RNA-binding S4 domain-containing protein [Cutibacterium avidum]PGX68401.1 RNA-binding protein [Cutibacterium avidum]PGX69412.1 RNA-binding protein [Cutibacterium avidum]